MSRDHTIACQPGQQERNSNKKERKREEEKREKERERKEERKKERKGWKEKEGRRRKERTLENHCFAIMILIIESSKNSHVINLPMEKILLE